MIEHIMLHPGVNPAVHTTPRWSDQSSEDPDFDEEQARADYADGAGDEDDKYQSMSERRRFVDID